MQHIDIVAFINHLAEQKASAITRQRKLAAIRGFLKFCKDNQIIYGNPADTIEGPIREERDPAILLKTEYKALLQVAGGTVKVRQVSFVSCSSLAYCYGRFSVIPL